MEIEQQYQAYLVWLGPPAVVMLVGAFTALRPPRFHALVAVLVAGALIAFLLATSQNGHCFEPTAEGCGTFWLAGFAGWLVSVALLALVLVSYGRSRRRSN